MVHRTSGICWKCWRRAPPSWRKAHFLRPVTTRWEWGPRVVPASRHQLCPSPSEGAVGSASRKGSGTSNPSPRRFPHRGAGPSILMRGRGGGGSAWAGLTAPPAAGHQPKAPLSTCAQRGPRPGRAQRVAFRTGLPSCGGWRMVPEDHGICQRRIRAQPWQPRPWLWVSLLDLRSRVRSHSPTHVQLGGILMPERDWPWVAAVAWGVLKSFNHFLIFLVIFQSSFFSSIN